MTLYLLGPATQPMLAATLLPNVKVTIHSEWIREAMSNHEGITIPYNERISYGGRTFIKLDDSDQAAFARAFYEIYSKTLNEMGYIWQKSPEIKKPAPQELARRLSTYDPREL